MHAVRFLPLGYQQLTSLGSAQSLTVPAGATMALFTADVESVRWRDDGTAPTASVGMLIAAGALPFEYTGTLSALQFIQVTGGAVLNVAYYRATGA